MTTVDDALTALRKERERLRSSLQETEAGILALEQVVGNRASTRPALKPQPADSTEPRSSRRSDGGPGTREQALEIFREHDGDALDADILLAELQKRGWQSSSERPRHVIVSTLWKMTQAGLIVKDGDGYVLAPEEPAEDQLDLG